MRFVTHAFRLAFLATALLLTLPSTNAQNTPPANNQRQPGAAYQDGFDHGKADAQSSMPSYGQPGDQWATEDTRSAYTLGYGAGYAEGRSGYEQSNSAFGASPSAGAMANPQATSGDAASFGYEDGRVAGRKDLDSGNAFRPADGAMYKKADRGWTANLGDKEQYQHAYREAYARGYQEGYGNSPTTY